MYGQEENNNSKQLPSNLGDAITKLKNDHVFIKKIGSDFISSFLKLKTNEWNEYLACFSKWEIDNIIDV